MGAKGATKGAGLGETLFLQWKERVSSGKNQRRHGVTDSECRHDSGLSHLAQLL
jgi:hypothetical protein